MVDVQQGIKHGREQLIANETWSHSDFARSIIESSKGSLIPLAEMPNEINLDRKNQQPSIGSACDELIKATMADPSRREQLKQGVVQDNKLTLQAPVTGTEFGVSGVLTLRTRSMQKLLGGEKVKAAAFSIHTHGATDVPPSPHDFTKLVIDRKTADEVAFIVVTETTKYLVIRSAETPSSSRQEAFKARDVATEKIATKAKKLKKEDRLLLQAQFVVDVCRQNKLALYIATEGNLFHRIEV